MTPSALACSAVYFVVIGSLFFSPVPASAHETVEVISGNDWPYCSGYPSYSTYGTEVDSNVPVTTTIVEEPDVIEGGVVPDSGYGWYNPVGWWNGYFYPEGQQYSRGYYDNAPSYRHN